MPARGSSCGTLTVDESIVIAGGIADTLQVGPASHAAPARYTLCWPVMAIMSGPVPARVSSGPDGPDLRVVVDQAGAELVQVAAGQIRVGWVSGVEQHGFPQARTGSRAGSRVRRR